MGWLCMLYCHAATPWREGIERSTRAQDLILNMGMYPEGAQYIIIFCTMAAHRHGDITDRMGWLWLMYCHAAAP